MLRDCIRDEAVARAALGGAILWDFFEQVEVANFEVASDAFSTFKDLLTRHKAAVAQFLSDHYTRFFEAFYRLLQSSNYVTRRQSLKVCPRAAGGGWGCRGQACSQCDTVRRADHLRAP